MTLHGTVDGQAVKDKAEATARSVGGVTEVKNLLQVVKESKKEAVKAVDKDVKEAVENSLKKDESLEGIKVKSVDNGLVLPGWKHHEPGAQASGHRDRLRHPWCEAGVLQHRDQGEVGAPRAARQT